MSDSEVSEVIETPGARVTVQLVVDVAQIHRQCGPDGLEKVLDQVRRLILEVRDAR